MSLESSLLSHLITRLTLDLEFLNSNNLISISDLELIKSKLPALPINGSPSSLNINDTAFRNDQAVASSSSSSSDIMSGGNKNGKKVVAIWSYASSQPDDLVFEVGDVIEINDEMNDTWYHGTLNGRTGLFPRNYVESFNIAPPLPPRLNSNFSNQSNNDNIHSSTSAVPYYTPSSTSYQDNYQNSFPPQLASPTITSSNNTTQSLQPYNKFQPQPHYPQGLTPYNPNQTQVVSTNPNEPPPIPKKPAFGKGKLGKQMASSFAGGIGFGAGMAVASEVVHAIL